MGKFASYDTHDDRSQLFDGGELEDEGEEGSRLPLLLVIGLLVVAAFSGVVWLAYMQGVERGREDAPRMLVAANGPVKSAPANPGGTDSPYKGLKIYQQPAPPEDTDAESSPQPPTPVTNASKPAQANPKPAAPVETASTATDANAQSPVVESIPFTANVASKPPRQLQTAAVTKPPVATKPVVATPKPVVAATKPAPKTVASVSPVQATPLPSVPAATPGTASSSASASGGVALQIGAYKSQEEAEASWKSFSRQHAMVSAYSSEVKQVDLGDKGVWYRLRLEGFADKSAATAFCDKLKADGGTCFLAR